MFRLGVSLISSTSTGVVATAQRRSITKLHTSYHSGYLGLNNLTGPRATVPKGSLIGAALRGQYANSRKAPAATEKDAAEDIDFEAAAEEVDVLQQEAKTRAAKTSTTTNTPSSRPYVPLGEVSRIELQGDYLMEGGQPYDALRYYGVVAKAYGAAYPENDNQRASIAVKISRAFRCCGKHEPALQNAQHALYMLDNNPSPHMDLVCEALVELGEAEASLGKPNAGETFEDVLHLIDAYHSLGNSQRVMRILPRLGVRMGVNHDKKFIYASPFGADRVLHLGDYAMERAEAFYRSTNNQEGVVRVLEKRTQLINTALFEGKDTAGRIRTLRGYAGRRFSQTTGSVTPRELFTYSPTIHQVYLDRSQGVVAPLGQEEEVMPGANRKVIDDGHYLRFNKSRKGSTVRGVRSQVGGVNSMSSIYDY